MAKSTEDLVARGPARPGAASDSRFNSSRSSRYPFCGGLKSASSRAGSAAAAVSASAAPGSATLGDALTHGQTRDGRDARPARLFGVGCHGRGDRRFGLGKRVRGEAGSDVARERELRKIEAVVAGAFSCASADRPASVRPSSLTQTGA